MQPMRRARIREPYPEAGEDFEWWYFGTESVAGGVMVILVSMTDGRMKAVPIEHVKIEITGDLWPD